MRCQSNLLHFALIFTLAGLTMPSRADELAEKGRGLIGAGWCSPGLVIAELRALGAARRGRFF